MTSVRCGQWLGRLTISGAGGAGPITTGGRTMTGTRITARRRERVERLTDRQRSAFRPLPYWEDATGPGYDPDMAREDAIAEQDAWDEDMPCDAYDGEDW